LSKSWVGSALTQAKLPDTTRSSLTKGNFTLVFFIGIRRNKTMTDSRNAKHRPDLAKRE
jgi:hypothetical protein